MSRTPKAVALAGLMAGIFGSLWTLYQGSEARWLPFLSALGARQAFRISTIGMGVAGWFVSQSLIASRGLREGAIGDAVHDWTAPWNRWLLTHTRAANALLIGTSAFIDIFAIFLLGESLFGPSLRPGVALLLLFAFRQIAQATCALPTPPDVIWRHPGVPSLLVTYSVANDFFFSGHTAIAVLGAIEAAKLLPPWVAVAAAVVAILEGTAVLVLRAHYTMDVLTAIFAAYCAEWLATALCVGF